MADSTRLVDLFIRWQQLREQGQGVTPEELCRDCPELAEELKKHVDAMGSLNSFEGGQITRSLVSQQEQQVTVYPFQPQSDVPLISRYRIESILGKGASASSTWPMTRN
ncbi:MAG: hypothetical protein FJ271_06835 [Planctomycetes bacterium]|nr:hypothetical protein [Planctomycetota bacterium]